MGRGLRNFKVSFEDSGLTHYGGLVLFQRFCRKLQVKRMLQTYVKWSRQSRQYHPVELIMMMIFTMVAGMKRVSDTKVLHFNGCFQSLLGLRTSPTPVTLRECLKTLSPAELKGIIRIHDLLRRKIRDYLPDQSSLVFDLDSTILPVFGWKIEEANVGYNPKKPGRPCYHPLICFEAHTRDTWHGILRAGDTHPATGAEELWLTCQEKIPQYLYRIRIRADSGFYSHKFIEPLDDQKIGYVVVAKMTRPIQQKVQHLRYRTFRRNGWQVARFMYQPNNWKKAHPFIVVRRPKPQRNQDVEQLTLWEHKHYYYHTLVSNLDLNPENIWHFYKPRARCELDIRELKEAFPMGNIPTNSFLANQVHFHLILLTYDLINWFKRLCLPKRWNTFTLQTLRRELFGLPARLVFSGGKNRLKLPLLYPHKKVFFSTIKRIDQLNIS